MKKKDIIKALWRIRDKIINKRLTVDDISCELAALLQRLPYKHRWWEV